MKKIDEKQNENAAKSRRVQTIVRRSPLAPGNKYRFNGFNTWVKIMWFSFPGTKHDDGGLPGVTVKWWSGKRGFYPFKSEQDFWDCHLFSNLIDW